MLQTIMHAISWTAKEIYKSGALLIFEYKSLLQSVAFNEDLDFLTKFMTVTINLLIAVEFIYFVLPLTAKKFI